MEVLDLSGKHINICKILVLFQESAVSRICYLALNLIFSITEQTYPIHQGCFHFSVVHTWITISKHIEDYFQGKVTLKKELHVSALLPDNQQSLKCRVNMCILIPNQDQIWHDLHLIRHGKIVAMIALFAS